MVTRHVCWDPELVRRYFTTEASVISDRNTFMRLHLPIERIEIIDSKPMEGVLPSDVFGQDGKRFTSETGLLRAITRSRPDDPNRIFVITGEPGSGKSHLARWVEFSLHDHASHRPIHIPRHIDTLGSVVRQLLDKGDVQLGQAAFEQDWFKAPEEVLAEYVLANFKLRLARGTRMGEAWPELTALVNSVTFKRDIERQVAQYKFSRSEASTGYKDREILALTSRDFDKLIESSGTGLAGVRRVEAYEMLGHTLKNIVRQMAGIGDFDLKFAMRQISERFLAREQRAVLILEDVTSFELLHEDLLTFLLDSSAGHFDALIGWTIGFEREYMRTYQEQRYAARLSLTDDQLHETYALMDGRYVDLVRRYMSLVRQSCPICTVDAFGPGLYPFNDAFLRRVYDNLIADDRQSRRTPRHLLDRALKRYLEIAANDGPYPPLKQPTNVREILYDNRVDVYREDYPTFAALMAWYGVPIDGALYLPAVVPRLFGVLVPPEFRDVEEIRFQITGLEGSDLPVNTADQRRVERENQLKELFLELQQWFAGSGQLEHAELFRRGAYRLLRDLKYELPLHLEHPAGSGFNYGLPLEYGRDKPETNIYIEGTRLQAPALETVVISRDEDRWSETQMKRLMQTMVHVQIFDAYPEDVDFVLIGDWANCVFADFRQRVEGVLDSEEGIRMSLSQFILAAKFLLLNWSQGAELPSYSALAVPLEKADAISIELLPAEVDFGEALGFRDAIDGMFQSLFHLSKDHIDYTLLFQEIGRFDPAMAISDLRRVAVYKVDVARNFRVGGQDFRDIVEAFKKLGSALDKAEYPYAYRRVRTAIQAVAEACGESARLVTHSIEKVRSQINQYELHGALYRQADWTAWDQHLRHLRDVDSMEFSELRVELEALLASHAPKNIFQYIAFARRADAVMKRPDYQLLAAARKLLLNLQTSLAKGSLSPSSLQGPPEVLSLVADLQKTLEDTA